VPYLYGGSTLDCAIFETVLHEVPIVAADKFVDLDDFAQRSHGQLVPNRDLKLVDLTSDGLLWMSKQRDRDHALLLFGDRLAGVLSGTRMGGPLETNLVLYETLRAGIDAA
jgi:hypothetical protein